MTGLSYFQAQLNAKKPIRAFMIRAIIKVITIFYFNNYILLYLTSIFVLKSYLITYKFDLHFDFSVDLSGLTSIDHEKLHEYEYKV